MNSKSTILIVPSAVKNHVSQSLYLADRMSEKFEVHYAVANAVDEKLILENNFKTYQTTKFRIGTSQEKIFLFLYKKRLNAFTVAYTYWIGKIHYLRQKELFFLVNKINPKIIIIDKFSSTDFLVLYPLIKEKGIKVAFYNPMLSTYTVPGFPNISQDNWDNKEINPSLTFYEKIKEKVVRFTQILRGLDTSYQINKIFEKNKIPVENKILTDSVFVTSFDNIPELVLAPSELEFSELVPKKFQHYLGLNIKKDIVDTELDFHFDRVINHIKAEKSDKNGKIIYCSFGTYYEGYNKYLFYFLITLLEAINSIENVQLICSVNEIVSDAIKSYGFVADNIYFFTRVPQLEVLKNTDVYISHGGLSSIKEAIFFTVPMLIYPLDLEYDQRSNALKVEFHKIGLRGIGENEDAEDMREKIVRLLENTDINFKENIEKLCSVINKKYTDNYVDSILNQIFNLDL